MYIRDYLNELFSGRATARAAAERIITKHEKLGEEAGRIFTFFDREDFLNQAEACDALVAAGATPASHPLLGVPVSVKDLFATKGNITTAGSKVLRNSPPETRDAAAVERLRAAGAMIVGKTNMSEFAFSGVGLNPHYGSPFNPADPSASRITGGSSSGAAASLGHGLCLATIGSDTGGSVRIPAALCGLVGYKPTINRIPAEGTVPLSPTLDTVGPLAHTVEDCTLVSAIMAGELISPDTDSTDLRTVRFAVPDSYILSGCDEWVMRAFTRSLALLEKAGAQIVEIAIPELDGIPAMVREATFPGYEGYARHRHLIIDAADQTDPFVMARFEAGSKMTEEAYEKLQHDRQIFEAAVEKRLAGFDALLMPTVPVIAPPFSCVATQEDFLRINALLLRNPTIVNLMGGCAVSLPNTADGSLPTGLSICCTAGRDESLLRIASSVSSVI